RAHREGSVTRRKLSDGACLRERCSRTSFWVCSLRRRSGRDHAHRNFGSRRARRGRMVRLSERNPAPVRSSSARLHAEAGNAPGSRRGRPRRRSKPAHRTLGDRSSADGATVRGYLTLADNAARPAPAVVLALGDLYPREYWTYDFLAQYLAAKGYAVLRRDYRGSTRSATTTFRSRSRSR